MIDNQSMEDIEATMSQVSTWLGVGSDAAATITAAWYLDEGLQALCRRLDNVSEALLQIRGILDS